jgi:hypothetical protein
VASTAFEANVSAPVEELSVRQAGRGLPVLEIAQFLYGGMPPLACNWTENPPVPTEPVRLLLVVVTASLAGTVMLTVPDFVASLIEVAVTVTVCDELVAAGAVNVAEDVVAFVSDPAETANLTPAPLRSFVTEAFTVTESAPSTVVLVAVTLTTRAAGPPPQPAIHKDTKIPSNVTAHLFRTGFLSLSFLPDLYNCWSDLYQTYGSDWESHL